MSRFWYATSWYTTYLTHFIFQWPEYDPSRYPFEKRIGNTEKDTMSGHLMVELSVLVKGMSISIILCRSSANIMLDEIVYRPIRGEAYDNIM